MNKELETAVKAAKAAGKILSKNFGTGISAEKKSPKELVTPIDFECEKKILSVLEKDFPEYSVSAEEGGETIKGNSNARWIVDPLDGTHNFFFGIPIFGVSIALAQNNEVLLGVIFLPMLNELFTAEKGKGAFLNGSPIHVSSRAIENSLVSICKDIFSLPNGVEKFKAIKSNVFNTRSFGAACFSLPYIAAGRFDARIEFNEKPTDFAAGMLLVREAGGKITGPSGKKLSLNDSSYIASNGVFHDKLVELLGVSD